jgi:elongation factor Ts
MNISIDQLKKLRAETLAGIADCRQALEDAKGDYTQAKKLIAERGLDKAAKKADRETAEGIIEAYVHATGKVGVLVELKSETDFVARNEEFKKLAHEIALQVAAMNPQDVKTLLASEYIRDASLTIEQLIKLTIAKVGENITVSRISRLELGEKAK